MRGYMMKNYEIMGNETLKSILVELEHNLGLDIDVSDGYNADLCNADLRKADLCNVDLRKADLDY